MVAWLAGETSVGADGAGAVAGFTVSGAVRVTPPNTAEIVAVVAVVTDVVVTVKLALVDPAETVTLAGVDTDVALSETETVAPPLGAAPLKVTVPCEEAPPVTLDGLTATAVRVTPGGAGGAVTMSEVNAEPLPNLAVRFTFVLVDTANVCTLNVTRSDPAATVIVAGMAATAALELESVTCAPPAGAAPSSTTVAVDVAPPVTISGSRKKDFARVAVGVALTVNCLVCVVSPTTAEIVTTLSLETACV